MSLNISPGFPADSLTSEHRADGIWLSGALVGRQVHSAGWGLDPNVHVPWLQGLTDASSTFRGQLRQ